MVVMVALSWFGWKYLVSDEPRDLSNATSIGPNTKGSPSENTSASQFIGGGEADDDDKTSEQRSDSATDSVVEVVAPTGNFVSSHNVSLDSLMASSCVTTSGATCTIVFMNGGTEVALEERLTDLEGAAYWEWKPGQIGLATGDWTIEARAASGNVIKTSRDTLVLRIRP